MKALLASFGYALAGIVYALRTQRNFKIHVVITTAVILLGLWLGLAPNQWAMLAMTVGVVLHTELINTALEAIVDKVAPEFHPLAKVAKDCAAGSVLIVAIAAVLVGLLVLGPPLLTRVTRP
jgi:diacylglycerol kinase